MKNAHILTKLIARVLIDIRVAAYSNQPDICFSLSDFIHHIPYLAEKVINKETDYQDAILYIKERAKIKKLDSWLDNVLRDIQK